MVQGPAPATAPSPSPTPLPLWPVDAFEFNTRLPDGGHAARLLNETVPPADAEEARRHLNEAAPPPLTEAEEAVWRAAEATPAGQEAIAVGGWVCAGCTRPVPYRSRSICGGCYRLRHDAAESVWAWRTDRTNWICAGCLEFNFERDGECRCCAATRPFGQEVRAVYHERVTDEVQRAHVGAVVNVRNRTARWRCPQCREVNSLQGNLCRNCQNERFALLLLCPGCNAPQQLSNRAVYGDAASDQHHYKYAFATANVCARLSPQQVCDHCQGMLHGAVVQSLGQGAWWCACGFVNHHTSQSCTRCRLPRNFPSLAVGRRLLLSAPSAPDRWDTVGSTNWLCDNCDGVNKASRHIVVRHLEGSSRPSIEHQKLPSSRAKPHNSTRLIHGDSACRHCHEPWHCQDLQGGELWRCACHRVNPKEAKFCTVCELPALKGLRVDAISMWTKGDWICPKCKAHNYRDRVLCVCGYKPG